MAVTSAVPMTAAWAVAVAIAMLSLWLVLQMHPTNAAICGTINGTMYDNIYGNIIW